MSDRSVLSPALWPFSTTGLALARKNLAVQLAVLLLLCTVPFCSQAQEFIDEEEINRLIEQLSSWEEFEREETYAALARIGEPAVPALIEAFESDHYPVRLGAAQALTQIGEPAIPALLEALTSDSPQVRWTAAHPLIWETLGDSFNYAAVISYTLLDALQDADPKVRRRAAQSLWEMTDESATPVAVRGDDAGPTVSALMAALQALDTETRRSALESLSETIETQPLASGQDLVAALIQALNDSEAAVRRIAAWTLGQIGEQGQVAIPQLTKALDDPSAGVRSAAAEALSNLGSAAEGATPDISPLLEDPVPLVRASAAIALATLGDHSQEVVLALRHALKFPNEDVREGAASTLGLIGEPAKDAVPELTDLLKDVFPEVRRQVALALSQIGEPAKDAVPQLRQALEDRDPAVRNFAARALGAMGAEVAVVDLRKALQDGNPSVRASAARSLGQIRYETDEAIPELSDAIKDPSPLVRKFSAEALGKIAIGLQEEAPDLSDQELAGAISNLVAAEQSLTAAAAADAEHAGDYKSALATIRLSLNALRTQRYGYFYEILANKWLLFAAIYLIVLPLFWWLLLWLRPLWLFHINHALEPYEFMAPRALGKNKFSTRYIVLVGFYYYHPRVLDAWVKANIATVRETFEYRATVKSHQAHVPLPLALNGITLPRLVPADLRPTFSKQPSYLLIWGEGGSGKIHLAIQIAKSAMSENARERLSEHPMLPVWIEQDLDFEIAKGEEDASPLTKAVRGQLQDLTHSSEPLSHGVVNAMLKRRSLLVIVDGLSERSEATRNQIRPELPDFPANALIVTSRVEEPLGRVTKSTIRTLRMSGDQFPAFLEGYLSELGKSDLRQSSRYADACDQFSQTVGKHRVPVLLASMYADRAIAAMQSGGAVGEMSGEGALVDDISGLMLSFFNALYSEIPTQPEEGMDIRSVQEVAKVVAWECMKASLRPQAAKRSDLLEALGGEDATARLRYLEKRLFLIEAVGVAQDRFRFTLELLAEYLAAAYLVDSNGANEASWRDVLQRADEIPGSETLGFLRALEVCCREEAQVPAFVAGELKKRTEAASTPSEEAPATRATRV